VPSCSQGVVRDFGWLSEREFLDAVAMGLITPDGRVTAVSSAIWWPASPVRRFAGIGRVSAAFLMVVLFARGSPVPQAPA